MEDAHHIGSLPTVHQCHMSAHMWPHSRGYPYKMPMKQRRSPDARRRGTDDRINTVRGFHR